ncbi:hypothetical protein KI387_000689, partial [Taxus chinensis]
LSLISEDQHPSTTQDSRHVEVAHDTVSTGQNESVPVQGRKSGIERADCLEGSVSEGPVLHGCYLGECESGTVPSFFSTDDPFDTVLIKQEDESLAMEELEEAIKKLKEKEDEATPLGKEQNKLEKALEEVANPLKEKEDEVIELTGVQIKLFKNVEEVTKQLKEKEYEEASLREIQTQLEKDIHATPEAGGTAAASTKEVDVCSIFVTNVASSCKEKDLQQHFQNCGSVNKVTIDKDENTKQPRGSSCVEFLEREAVANALLLNRSKLHGRELKVVKKRECIPIMVQRLFDPYMGYHMGYRSRRPARPSFHNGHG